MLKNDILELLTGLESKDDIYYLADHAAKDEKVFDALWDIVCNEEERLAWYAVWALENATRIKPDFLWKIRSQLYAKIPEQTHTGLKRGLFNLVTKIPLDEEALMPVFDKAMEWLQDPKETAAVRAQSVRLLFEVYKLEPDFKYELEALLTQQLDNNASTGLKNVIGKALRALANNSAKL